MKNLLIIASLFLFTSCTKILIHTYGFKTPRFESKERLSSFAKKHQLDESKIVFMNDSIDQKETLRLFANSPGIIITDSAWNRLDFQNKKENCSAPVENLLINLCTNSSSYIYYADPKLLKYLTNKSFKTAYENNSKATYYILFLWGSSMGKTIKKIKDWENILKKDTSCNYQTYWINYDYMAEWYGYKAGKKIKYSIDRKN